MYKFMAATFLVSLVVLAGTLIYQNRLPPTDRENRIPAAPTIPAPRLQHPAPHDAPTADMVITTYYSEKDPYIQALIADIYRNHGYVQAEDFGPVGALFSTHEADHRQV